MIQDILTFLAISVATGYSFYSLIKVVINTRQKKTTCGGCSNCSVKHPVEAHRTR